MCERELGHPAVVATPAVADALPSFAASQDYFLTARRGGISSGQGREGKGGSGKELNTPGRQGERITWTRARGGFGDTKLGHPVSN